MKKKQLIGEGYWQLRDGDCSVTVGIPAWSDRNTPYETLRDTSPYVQGELLPERFTWREYQMVGRCIKFVPTDIHPTRTGV